MTNSKEINAIRSEINTLEQKAEQAEFNGDTFLLDTLEKRIEQLWDRIEDLDECSCAPDICRHGYEREDCVACSDPHHYW